MSAYCHNVHIKNTSNIVKMVSVTPSVTTCITYHTLEGLVIPVNLEDDTTLTWRELTWSTETVSLLNLTVWKNCTKSDTGSV